MIEVKQGRRLSLEVERVRKFWPHALLLLLTLVAVAALRDRPLVLSASAVGIGGLVAMTVDRRLIIPIIVLLLPLEIGGRLVPILQTEGSAKLDSSALGLARIGIILGALLWAVRAPAEWWRDFPRSSLYLPLILLFGLYLLSLSGTENLRGGIEEVARLAFHLTFFVLIAIYVRDRQTLRWAVLALIASGLMLALIGIFQQITDTYLWNEGLAGRGIRRNATFVDPNIYARFLVVAMVMALALFFGERSRLRYVLAATFVLATVALPFTSSRSNWLTAAAVIPLLMLILPVKVKAKVGLLAFAAFSGITLVVFSTAVEPALADRLNTLSSGTDALGIRTSLIRAGWQMFLDNPVFGVGVDSFAEAVQGPYRHFLPANAGTIFSHTSAVTVLAELGILGFGVLVLLLYRSGRLCWYSYRGGRVQDKALAAGLAMALVAIFVSSQSEGRFFEEPYLWLVLGLASALAGIRWREAQNEIGREARVER